MRMDASVPLVRLVQLLQRGSGVVFRGKRSKISSGSFYTAKPHPTLTCECCDWRYTRRGAGGIFSIEFETFKRYFRSSGLEEEEELGGKEYFQRDNGKGLTVEAKSCVWELKSFEDTLPASPFHRARYRREYLTTKRLPDYTYTKNGKSRENVSIKLKNPGIGSVRRFDGYFGFLKGRQLPGTTINAKISHVGDSVALQCVGKASAENVSWWLYGCSEVGGKVEGIHLSRDVVFRHPQYYELLTARTAGVVTSTLRVKKLNATEVTGLYRCGLENPEVTHYFIVGRKKSLGNCFGVESPVALLKAIQSFIGAAEGGAESHEYILKLPRGDKRTHDYRVRFSLPGNANSRSPGDSVEENRKTGCLHVIKFDESDAVGVKG